MENQDYSYKEDIIATRKGCVGSSDARMLMQIASIGEVPKSAYRRVAIIKGFDEQEDNLHTPAVEFGNQMEMAIFNLLKQGNPTANYVSNPRWESVKYSRENVRCIAHPDIVMEDERTKTISVYEVKTSCHSFDTLRKEYKAQLFYQSLLAKERAEERGNWKVKMHLVHYNTEGLDLEQPHDFDPERLTIGKVICHSNTFDLARAMNVLDAFLATMTEETARLDVVEAEYLPANVKTQFDAIAGMLREIKEREAKIELFKSKLYEFLTKRRISKVKCDDFSFTIVEPTSYTQFDAKAWWEEMSASLDKEEYDALVKRFSKVINKKGFVKILVNNKD